MTQIRPIETSDADAFLHLCLALDAETRTMMLEPGERSPSVDCQRHRIEEIRAAGHGEILVAEVDQGLAGFVEIQGGVFRRNRHSATLALGVLRERRGQGIGRRLLEAAEAWSRRHGIHRLELTVMTHNEAAVCLYRSHGFCIEGTRVDSLLVDGAFVDEYAMSKRISDKTT